MKTFTYIFATLVAWVASPQAQAVVRPIVATEFGKPIVVRAEFVAKPNDYYSQNMVTEPYMLKVVAVNGQPLKEPVIIEYKLHADKGGAAKVEHRGTVVTFEAYESVYQPSTATPWLGAGEQGTTFALIHVLHVRPQRHEG
jgi:hypothetical protein